MCWGLGELFFDWHQTSKTFNSKFALLKLIYSEKSSKIWGNLQIIIWNYLFRGLVSFFWRFLPIPFASSKIFWPCSNFFLTIFNIFWTHSNFLTMVKSNILPYKFAYLNLVKKFWAQPIFFKLADGLALCHIFVAFSEYTLLNFETILCF